MKLYHSAKDMRYFVIFLILIALSGMIQLFDNALAGDPPLIISKVELWGPSSFIANDVKFCIENTVGQLGPWAVGWIEIQNIQDKTITVQDSTLHAGSVHSLKPITLEAKKSCIFQTQDQITTRIGPGGSGGNGPPYGYDNSTVVFDYVIEENGKKTRYTDTTPEISDTFGDARIWELVNDKWIFKENPMNGLHSFPPPELVISPLKQFKSGIPIDEIKCKENLLLAIKTSNKHPACVKQTTLEKLYFRGWGDCGWNCSHEIPENLIESQSDIPYGSHSGPDDFQTEITGNDARAICSAVRIPCPSDPVFRGGKLDEFTRSVSVNTPSDFYEILLNKTHVCVTSTQTKTTECKLR